MRRILAVSAALVGACSYTSPGATPGDDVVIDANPDPDGSTVDTPPSDGPSDTSADAPAQVVALDLIEDLDADIGVTGTSDVTAWANQVAGAGDNVNKTAGVIMKVANAVNAHAAIRFVNAERMEGQNQTAFQQLTNGAGFTWFAVVSANAQDSTTKNQIFGTIMQNNPFSGFTAGANTSNSHFYTMVRPNSTEVFAQSDTNTTGSWVVVAGRLAGGTGNKAFEVFVNSKTAGATGAINVPGGQQCGVLTIGAEHASGTEFFSGDVTRILIYARALSDAELAETGRALSDRYAITTSF